MAFVSLAVLAFVTLVALVYFAVPRKVRWVVLLVASYFFFYLNSEWLLLVLFAQTCITFGCGLMMAKVDERATAAMAEMEDKKQIREAKVAARTNKKRFMVIGVLINVGALLFLKYYNFFADNANVLLSILGVQLPPLGLIVPIGMSFYTLQAIAYLVDVQRGKIEADRSLPKFMLFMSYFPQILQGPIPRHQQLAGQLYEGHSFDYKRMCYGMQLMLWGFMKKMIIADRLAIPVNQIFDNYAYYDGMIVFLAAAGYGLQVYADFSGGIDIARGFSEILGIQLTDNFRQPYFSRSIEDFWRRWHITLGAFMRDYVFYPLSLSKAFGRIGKKARSLFGSTIGKRIPPFIAMFIVYFLVGFWHGANWTYITYGVWNGVFITLGILLEDRYAQAKSKLGIDEESSSWKLFQMFRTFIICSIGRYFSRAATITACAGMIRRTMVNWWDLSFIVDGSLLNLGLDVGNWIVLGIGVLVLLLVDIAHERGISLRDRLASQGIAARWLVYLLALACVLVFGVYGSDYDAASFIYQQF